MWFIVTGEQVMEMSNGHGLATTDSENLANREGLSSESVTNGCNSAGTPMDCESSDMSLKLGWAPRRISITIWTIAGSVPWNMEIRLSISSVHRKLVGLLTLTHLSDLGFPFFFFAGYRTRGDLNSQIYVLFCADWFWLSYCLCWWGGAGGVQWMGTYPLHPMVKILCLIF